MKSPLRCILVGICVSILVLETDTATPAPTAAPGPAPTAAPTAAPGPALTAAPGPALTAAPAPATQNPAGGPNNGHSQPGGGNGGGNGGNGLHQLTTETLSKFTGMILVTLFINRYQMFL
ncbi:cyclin-dependent kinase inhibitor 1C-like [Ruditapes philippinarum]|uniref:cyclin-dependent kinase inhibitor 1C-like n=1 Tax=Ruditapes philippinarum TaxID=129788 RepID=UPI00295B6949|nr:cyclin-dependent kinase inhibitor 1C-like [Ruditapes philippinarum]